MDTPPLFLFVQVNKRCNLRCQHCDFWHLDDDDRPNYQPWPRKQEMLREFAEIAPGAGVVICGGESMLDLEDYFAISNESRALGLRSYSVINGTRVRDRERGDRMMVEGPDEINVSLNAHHAELHDRTRGVKGSFDKAVKALRVMIEARKRHDVPGKKINVMGLIFDENYRDLDKFYDFVLNDVGADKLKLNFLQPSFGHVGKVDDFFRDHYKVDADELVAIIDRCDANYALGLNPEWRKAVHMYFKSLNRAVDIPLGWNSSAGTTDHICSTYERNIMVDHYGVARLCFSTMFPGMQIARYGDLRRFWYGADPIRGQMRRCNHYCGISHSVRRETSTIASRRPLPVPVVAAPAPPKRVLSEWSFIMKQG